MRVEEAPDGFRGVQCRGWSIELQRPRDRRVRTRLAGPLVPRTGDGDQLHASTVGAVRDRRGDRTGAADRRPGAAVDPAPGADQRGHGWAVNPDRTSGAGTAVVPLAHAPGVGDGLVRGTVDVDHRDRRGRRAGAEHGHLDRRPATLGKTVGRIGTQDHRLRRPEVWGRPAGDQVAPPDRTRLPPPDASPPAGRRPGSGQRAWAGSLRPVPRPPRDALPADRIDLRARTIQVEGKPKVLPPAVVSLASTRP